MALSPKSVPAIGEPEIRALCVAIHAALDEVKGYAASARAILRDSTAAACPEDASAGIVETRAAEIAAVIDGAEAAKVAALETELIAADATLEQLQRETLDGVLALQPTLLARYGPPPLHPCEPCELRLVVPATARLGEERSCCAELLAAEVVSARIVSPGDVYIPPLQPLQWAVLPGPFRFVVSLAGAPTGSSSAAAVASSMQTASASLASRLRVKALACPRPGQPRPVPAPVPLPVTCSPDAAGAGACVSIALPDALPFCPSGVPGAWCLWELRVVSVYLGGEQLPVAAGGGGGGSSSSSSGAASPPAASAAKAVPAAAAAAAAARVPLFNRPGPTRPPGTLHAACCSGDVSARAILAAAATGAAATTAAAAAAAAGGWSTEERDAAGRSCLWWAAFRGHAEVVKALITAGADVTAAAAAGEGAAGGGESAAAAGPLAAGKGLSPLHAAVVSRQTPAAGALLADPRVDPNARADYAGYSGATPLHVAALHGHIQVLKYLLEYPGVDAEAEAGSRFGPRLALEVARDRGEREAAALLAADQHARRQRRR
jgi:hypothetical protein